ncbi:hypothetical protein [Roseiconus lacunae]|uniref:Uncharacterized protein n=1 Tax=Roseiconus lacunae TaxID=2605694 RepID=A0ABT7PHA2_9BACT|nr:hypothetical protein [Roseiconus lacunae]MDM4015862.1 hypothetical protein [Roseiconus lacunae]
MLRKEVSDRSRVTVSLVLVGDQHGAYWMPRVVSRDHAENTVETLNACGTPAKIVDATLILPDADSIDPEWPHPAVCFPAELAVLEG